MIRSAEVLERLQELVGRGSHQAEAVLHASHTGMTRFAASRIHQNLERQEADVVFRLALDRQVGVARTGDLTPAGLEACFHRATAIAQVQKPNPWVTGLSDEQTGDAAAKIPQLPAPARRLELAQAILGEVQRAGLEAAGSYSTVNGEVAVVNSAGCFARAPYRTADSVLVAMDGGRENGPSGYAAWSGHDPEALDPRGLAATATEKCLAGRQTAELETGPIDVLLEPPAVAGLLDWLGYIGFGGKQFNEGTSFLSGQLGERVTGSAVTICDDHAEIEGMGLVIDFEGVRRRRVDLVRDGVAAGVVHDRFTGARAEQPSTGHALSPDNDGGPMPLNLSMAPGDATREEMIASMDRGLVVTRFHYLNGLLDTRRALFTGMTRDGTFLVRNGEVVGSVANLRFTEPILEAFCRIEAIGRERQSLGTWNDRGSTCTVPSLLIRDFHFDNGD